MSTQMPQAAMAKQMAAPRMSFGARSLRLSHANPAPAAAKEIVTAKMNVVMGGFYPPHG